jgi:hypothetical protein
MTVMLSSLCHDAAFGVGSIELLGQCRRSQGWLGLRRAWPSRRCMDRGAADDPIWVPLIQRPVRTAGPRRLHGPWLDARRVCALDVLAGIWVWQDKPRGARLGLATTPLALALGIGFALPFLLLPAPIRAALVVAGWRSLG